MIKNFNLNSNFLIYNAYTASCIPGLTDRLMMAGNSQSEPATILHHGLIEDLVPALGTGGICIWQSRVSSSPLIYWYNTIILSTVFILFFTLREVKKNCRNVRNGTHLMISSTKMIKSIKLYVIILWSIIQCFSILLLFPSWRTLLHVLWPITNIFIFIKN